MANANMFNFSKQVVIVTGAAGNLGSAVVNAFEAAGATLVATDSSSGRLSGMFPKLANTADHLLADGVDITNPEAAQAFIDETLRRFKRIDVLINTVGGYRAGTPLHETSLETFDLMMNLNVRSMLIMCRAVIPTMLKQGTGKVVNVSSPIANHGSENASAYSAAKSAVARITESMAAEYKRAGLNINAILPGTIDTPQNHAAMPEADSSTWVTPDALADVILFLSSDAAHIIQGVLLPVTGKG